MELLLKTLFRFLEISDSQWTKGGVGHVKQSPTIPFENVDVIKNNYSFDVHMKKVLSHFFL